VIPSSITAKINHDKHQRIANNKQICIYFALARGKHQKVGTTAKSNTYKSSGKNLERQLAQLRNESGARNQTGSCVKAMRGAHLQPASYLSIANRESARVC